MGAFEGVLLSGGFVSIERGNQDIFENAALRQEMVHLKNQPDGMIAKSRQLIVVKLRQILTIEYDGAAIGAIQCADDIEQSAFARAGHADNGECLARFDSERDIFEDGQGRPVFGCRITFTDVDKFE